MAGKPFSVLYPQIRGHVKRAPQVAVDVAILDAARDFCRLSRFRQDTILLDLQASVQWYDLVPTNTDEEVIGVDRVQYNGQSWPCPVYAGESSESADGPWTQDRPTQFFYEPPKSLVLLRMPASSLATGCTVQAILQPTDTATTLDETLFQRYHSALAAGAIAFLLNTNNSEWSNPAKAEKYEADFESGWQKAAADRDTGFKPRHTYTKVHRF